MMMNKQKMKNGNIVSIFFSIFPQPTPKGWVMLAAVDGTETWTGKSWGNLGRQYKANLNKTHFYRFFTRVSSVPLPSSHLGTIQMEKILYFGHDDTELLKYFVSGTVSSVPAHLSHFGIVVVVCRRRLLRFQWDFKQIINTKLSN